MSRVSRFLHKLTPPTLRFKLVSMKHALSKFQQIHYSQNGEDIILKGEFPRGHKGFYVDIGAHHPYRISNTYKLYKAGWHGINIDANPDTIALFKRARPHDTNLHIGVGREEKKLTYHRFADPAVNTFSDTEAEKWKRHPTNAYLGTSEVQIKPLRNILNAYISPDQQIDLMNIDVEGLDFDVLETNDWQRYAPTILMIEDHTFSIATKDENRIYRFLLEHGYELVHKLRFTLIFRKRNS